MKPEPIDSDATIKALDARFRGPLMSFFLRRIGNRAECEDLTQEVFTRLVSAPTLAEVQNVEAFVFRVAANLLLDRQRHAKRWQFCGDPTQDRVFIDEITRYYVENREPERVLSGKETLASVLTTLRGLGDRTCNMFILFRLENMKQRDIASLYGISPSTVEKHIAKAVMHLASRHTRGGDDSE